MIMVTSMLPSCTSVLGVMEPLLPETAEGGDARARPNEDARQGGVFGELEATDAARKQRKETLDTPRWKHMQDRAGELSTRYGGTVRDGGIRRSLNPMQSFILPAKALHLPTPETSGERSSLTVRWTPPPSSPLPLPWTPQHLVVRWKMKRPRITLPSNLHRPRGALSPKSFHCIAESPGPGVLKGPEWFLPSHKAGHWVLGLQVFDPSAADPMVQGTLTICNDSTDLTNNPCGLHATQMGALPTLPRPLECLIPE